MAIIKPAPFKFRPFSKKQKQVLTWWRKGSPHKDKDGIICDGSIRAGKTVVMSLSYIMWAMDSFDNELFGFAGKTIGALRRNVINPLKRMLDARGYTYKEHRADNMIVISKNGITNTFYYFGGKDESSQDLIQGITLAGMFFDEVALMPESFVNQATGRLSIEGSKSWFNCNPSSPKHWFKENWLDKKDEKHLLHLHFTMDDNLSLSVRVRERYKRLYTGVFFQRFILGLWVLAEGVIFDMFKEEVMTVTDNDIKDMQFKRYWISIDQGFTNATVFLLNAIGDDDRHYILDEYYHSGNTKKNAGTLQKSPSDYATDLKQWIVETMPAKWKHLKISRIFIDPASKGFITQCYQMGIHKIAPIMTADNSVKEGIEFVSSLMSLDHFRVHVNCENLIKNFSTYIWDEKAQERGEDKPVKQDDDAVDACRYGAYSMRNLYRHVFKKHGIDMKEVA